MVIGVLGQLTHLVDKIQGFLKVVEFVFLLKVAAVDDLPASA